MLSFYRLIKQFFHSTLLAIGLPPHSCRFSPSCSRYCGQAIKTYGPFRGLRLCLKRILRCNPLFKSGFDPLP